MRLPTDASVGVRTAFEELDTRVTKLQRDGGGLSKSDLTTAIEGLRSDILKLLATPAFPNPNSVFRASGPAHAMGLVPDPTASTGTETFLREDAQFAYAPLRDASDIGQTDAIKRYNLQGGLIVNGPLAASDVLVGTLNISGESKGKTQAARVALSGDTTVTTATPTTLSFNTTRYDYGLLFSALHNTRLTAAVAGPYAIGGCVQFAANATGLRRLEIQINGNASGTGTSIGRSQILPGAATIVVLNVSVAYYLAAGDYVELVVNQTSGGDLVVPANGNYSPEFWMHQIGSLP